MTATAKPECALSVRGLRVEVDTGRPIVDGLDLEVRPGEIVGLVGESGSGKTTAALALLGYAPTGTRIAGGSVVIGGHHILDLDDRQRRRLRGSVVSYVPQDAGQALNPSLRIGAAISDVIREHRATGREAVTEMLAAVDLPATAQFAARLPHQLSGGQQQRVTIAMAISCDPPVIIMDEPTTGLDVLTQASVLSEVKRLRDELGAALVYVSHDLAVVSQLADRVAVMYAGRIVENGPTATILQRPRHPYTRGLVQSIPDHRRPRRLIAMIGTAVGVEDRPDGCPFAPRCDQRTDDCTTEVPPLTQVADGHEVRCRHEARTPPVQLGEDRVAVSLAQPRTVLEVVGLRATHGSGRHVVVAANDVSFELAAGECLALVGQSGSGKTTIARCMVGLHAVDGGRIVLRGTAMKPLARQRTVEQRRQIQYVFQNPFQSLNPRRTIADQLARPGQVLRGLGRRAALAEVPQLLEQVRLAARIGDRYPGQLSGGERQRVAIARALAAHPDVLVCDEITSALDVSVQAAVLDVLADLRERMDVAMLLITHDLGVVSVAADRIVVLQDGTVRETGTVRDVVAAPAHAYTRDLIAAAPRLDRRDEPVVTAGGQS